MEVLDGGRAKWSKEGRCVPEDLRKGVMPYGFCFERDSER